jgi:copper chaperone CopZ
MKFILGLLLFILAPSVCKADDIQITVEGMVCESCDASVRSVLMNEDGVENVKIDLENKSVTVHMMNDETISDEKIHELITWAGYETVAIRR